MEKYLHLWSGLDFDDGPIPALPDGDRKLAAVESLINKALNKIDIVGLGVGIVAENRIVFAKGYGKRDVNDKTATVDSKTAFAIGSCSKAFTSFAYNRLVNHEGKLHWTDRVNEHDPSLKLKDGQTTSLLRVQDMLTHTSGLPRHDMVMLHSTVPRSDLLKRLPYLEPNFDLREKWQYNNLMVVAAGVLMEKISGRSWEENIHEIFDLMGMNRSFASLQEVIQKKATNIASPHKVRQPGAHPERVEWMDITNEGPAGSIISSIEDMTKWVQRQLTLHGRAKEMHLAQVAIPVEPADGQTLGYGFGWMLAFYHGRRCVNHSGGINGAVAQVDLFPESKQGIVITANCDALSGFIANLAYRISDILIDHPSLNDKTDDQWLDDQAAGLKIVQIVWDQTNVTGETVPNPEQYTGSFYNGGYGELVISVKDKKLYAAHNLMNYLMRPKRYQDFFSCRSEFPYEFQFPGFFERDSFGEVYAFNFSLEPYVAPIRFLKEIDDKLKTPEYQKLFVGIYENPTSTIQVRYIGTGHQNLLVASGSLEYSGELAPHKPDKFRLRRTRVYYSFTRDNTGKLDGLRIYMGEMVTILKKNA